MMTRIKFKKGFTLVEMKVAVSVFSIVSLMVVSSLILIINGYKKMLNTQLAIDNLNYVVSSMVFKMKDASSLVTHSGSRASFEDYAGYEYSYQLSDEGKIQRSVDAGRWEDLTDSGELKVNSLTFVDRDLSRSTGQSLIVKIDGTAGHDNKKMLETSFFIQTTVSQRQNNLE